MSNVSWCPFLCPYCVTTRAMYVIFFWEWINVLHLCFLCKNLILGHNLKLIETNLFHIFSPKRVWKICYSLLAGSKEEFIVVNQTMHIILISIATFKIISAKTVIWQRNDNNAQFNVVCWTYHMGHWYVERITWDTVRCWIYHIKHIKVYTYITMDAWRCLMHHI